MVLFLPAFDGEVGYDYNPYQGKGLASTECRKITTSAETFRQLCSVIRSSVRHKGWKARLYRYLRYVLLPVLAARDPLSG